MHLELRKISLSLCRIPLSKRGRLDQRKVDLYSNWFNDHYDLEFPMKVSHLSVGRYELLEDPEILVAAEIKGIPSLSALIIEGRYKPQTISSKRNTSGEVKTSSPIGIAKNYRNVSTCFGHPIK